MSSALATFKLQQTRTGQHPAGVGATLAYNGMIKDVLPPIVRELEEKITELQKKIDELLKSINSK